jgi:co-chaperonin GroES (HSP10)
VSRVVPYGHLVGVFRREESMYNGVIHYADEHRPIAQRGMIFALGELAKQRAPELEVGDVVVFHTVAGDDFRINDRYVTLVPVSKILAKEI